MSKDAVTSGSSSYKWVTNFHRDLMAGAVMGGFVHTIVAPIERAKLLLQTQESNLAIVGSGRRRFKGMLDCILRTVREEGILSLWRGNVSSVLRYYPSVALNLSLKVQAVLLLLGGCELSSGPQGMEVIPHHQRGFAECPGRCTRPQRAASLDRFRQKRKERCFDNKVRYGVRQEVALRIELNKGQFTSAKKSERGDLSWSDAQDPGQDDCSSETSVESCFYESSNSSASFGLGKSSQLGQVAFEEKR